VLEPFTSSETSLVDAAIAAACEALNVALAEGVTAAMNRFHAA
jgi:peptidyl-tRNA hydrolase